MLTEPESTAFLRLYAVETFSSWTSFCVPWQKQVYHITVHPGSQVALQCLLHSFNRSCRKVGGLGYRQVGNVCKIVDLCECVCARFSKNLFVSMVPIFFSSIIAWGIDKVSHSMLLYHRVWQMVLYLLRLRLLCK